MTAEITLRDAYEIKEVVMLPDPGRGRSGVPCGGAGGYMERSAQETCSAKWVGS